MSPMELRLIKPLVRTQCYPDENPFSYLVRLANLNRYPSYRWLLAGKGVGTINYALLYKAFLREEWTGYHQSVPELGEISSLHNHCINAARLRYCPLCLQEETYWRIGWQIRLSATCTKHQIWLHDFCPVTRRGISLLDSLRQINRSSNNLIMAEVKVAPQSVQRIQQFLEKGIVNPENTLFDPQYQLSLVKRYKFIAFLIKFLEIRNDLTKARWIEGQYISQFRENLMQCADALFSDQSGFSGYLQTVHMKGTENVDIQQARLVTFYRQFFRQFSGPIFKPLKHMTESYATMHLISDITEKHTLFSPNAKTDQLWYSFQKACNEYGLASSVLSRAITDQHVKAHREVTEKYTKCAIYRPDLEKILPHLQGLIPASNAAHVLGVTKAQFHQLQNSGCFKFEIPPRQDYCQTWQYSLPELDAIIENANKGAAPMTADSLTIAQIMQHHMKGKIEMPFMHLFRAILSDQLIVRKSAPSALKIRALAIDREEFMAWLNKLCPNPEVWSVTEASKLLGVNEEFGYQLVNRGYLQHELDSRRGKVIHPEHITQFHQEYVILAKFLKEFEIGADKVIDILKSFDVFPVDHDHSEKLRQKLYRRADFFKTNLLYVLTARQKATFTLSSAAI